MTLPPRFVCATAFVAFLAATLPAHAAEHEFTGSLDGLLDLPAAWETKSGDLDAMLPDHDLKANPFFKFSKDGSYAWLEREPFDNVRCDFTLLNDAVPAEGAVLRFDGKDGPLQSIEVSIFEAGTWDEIDGAEYEKRYQTAKAKLTEKFGIKPRAYGPRAAAGGEMVGALWRNGDYAAFLSCDANGLSGSESGRWIRLGVVKPGKEAKLLVIRPTRDAVAQQLKSKALECPLDALVAIPDAWSLTPDKLDAMFGLPAGIKLSSKNPYFEWLTTSRDRAHFSKQPFSNLAVNLSLFGGQVPIEEAIVDFRDGKLNGITFSVYNRGDSGEIDLVDFDKRFETCGKYLGDKLEVRPFRRESNPAAGLLTEGLLWTSVKGRAILEYNPGARDGKKVEFMRLRMAPRDAQGGIAATISERVSAKRLSELVANVVHEGSDVYVANVPMVDQGPKGYCVVASSQRLFEYFGIPCDQHQLAQVAGSSAESGTSPVLMAKALKDVGYKYKTRLKELHLPNRTVLSESDFAETVKKYTDAGVPLLWGLALGKYPEEPDVSEQTGGYHMRLIIGYNEADGKVLFSDSWGAGHEVKRMGTDHAYEATTCLFALQPTTK